MLKQKRKKPLKTNASGQSEQSTPTQLDEQRDNQSKEPLGETDAKDEKKARIAAAVAKAKAKKAASQQAQASTPVGEADTDSQDVNLQKEANPQSVNGHDNSAPNNKALDSSSNLSEAEQKRPALLPLWRKQKPKKRLNRKII